MAIKRPTGHICLRIHEVRKGIWDFLCLLCFSGSDWLGRRSLITCLVIKFRTLLLLRVPPEKLFLDLAVHQSDTSAADILAITTGLDVNSLYEVI